MLASENSMRIINMAAFFLFGLIGQGLFAGVGVSGAEDILAGTTIATSVVVLCITGPYFTITLLMPPFVHRLPKSAVVTLQFCCFESGLLLIALVHNLMWNLVGVCFVSCGGGLGDVCFLAWTSCYERNALRAFTAGTGAGIWFASMYYAAMTTWLCVSPSTTMLTLLCLPPLAPLFYCLMEKKETGAPDIKTTSFKEVSYSLLDPASKDDCQQEDLDWREKLQTVRENALLLCSVFIGYFFEYLCIQSIVTTLAFPDAPFDPRDHYQYYIFIFWFGEFVGRFYNLIVSACPSILPTYTRHTWVFTSFILASALLLLFDAWFRYLHSVWIVLAVVLFIGINAGALYGSTYAAAALGSSSRRVEFSRAFLNVGVGAGMVVASLIGLITEHGLKEHCLQSSEDDIYCTTRAMNWSDHKCFHHA